jgi:hypothetical protein
MRSAREVGEEDPARREHREPLRRREALRPAFGEGEREEGRGGEGRRGERERPVAQAHVVAPRAERDGDAGERQEQPGDRAPGAAQGGQGEREPRAPALEREQRGEPDRRSQRVRDAPDEQVACRRRGEHVGGDECTRAEVGAREPLEQRCRRDGRERADEARAEQGGERWRQERVAGRVVAAVPLRVPHREPVVREQVGAVNLCGEVRRRGREHEPQRREHERDHPGCRQRARGRRPLAHVAKRTAGRPLRGCRAVMPTWCSAARGSRAGRARSWR